MQSFRISNDKSRLLFSVDYQTQRFVLFPAQTEWAKPQRRSPKPVASQFMADPKPLGGMFKPVRAVNAARRIMGKDSSEPTASSSMAGLHEGTKIEHQRFGIGTVLKVEGTGENAKATVDFANSGRKQLLLKFAKFTVIG